MVDGFALTVWAYRIGFLLLVSVYAFFALLPLGGGANGLPWPDLMFCGVLAWVLRRPDYMPFWLVVLAGLLTDFLFFKAPGAWTLMVLVASEAARQVGRSEGTISLAVEALTAVAAVFGAFIGYFLLMKALGAPTGSLGAIVLEMLFTIAAYPVVVAFTVYILRVQRPDIAEAMTFKIRT